MQRDVDVDDESHPRMSRLMRFEINETLNEVKANKGKNYISD